MALEAVVVVADSPGNARPLCETVGPLAGTTTCIPLREAAEQLTSISADLALIGPDVPADEALRLIQNICSASPSLPVVVIAGSPSVDGAVRSIKRGAHDYIAAPLDAAAARCLIEGVEGERSSRDSRGRYFAPACPPGVPFVGQSDGAVQALEMVRLVAESRCNPILLLGETGTGKELAARAVHAWRCGEPERFVAVNCAALTASLLESELFGHVKGAFTGADREKTGLFEAAGAGTIFLDEISEMPADLQAKLLRVLQERHFRKVGGTKDLPCEATVVASSNRDLFAETRAGRFRRDLYYRLAVFPIRLPALRDPTRRDDVPLLAEYFVETSEMACARRVEGISPEAKADLMNHDWPGNVRELRNVIDRALLLERSELITPTSLRVETDGHSPAGAALAQAEQAKDFSLETAEREFILRALKETGWTRTRAAALLGITRATLHAKLKRYGIQVPKPNSSAGKSDEADKQDKATA